MKKGLLFIIPLLAWLVYSGLLMQGKLNTSPDKFNYFKNLAISLLHGRLDIDCPPGTDCHDLVEHKGKRYLYWPPVPALIYIPFVLIAGENTPDFLICSLFGAFNVLLLIILLLQFSKKFNLNLSYYVIAYFALFWAFGTVHFYMSMLGSVWYISQVMAQTFLLLALIFILKEPVGVNLILSGLFFSMASYTKNDLIFSVFLIAVLYFCVSKKSGISRIKKDAVMFLIPFFIFTFINMSYNYARFHNPFKNGIKQHQMSGHFAENYKKYGYLSLCYVPGNFVREVIIPPPLTGEFPFFKFDPEGFGFLWASPFFILLIGISFHFYFKKINGFKNNLQGALKDKDFLIMTGALCSGILISFLIFMIMGTGWIQFASRYSLDYQIMIIIFGLFGMKSTYKNRIFNYTAILLLIISIYINYFGARFYLGNL
jgi:hypothetical protein